MIRAELEELIKLGRFPSSKQANLDAIRRQEKLLRSVRPPVTDDEAVRLIGLFGPDDYFGVAWTVLHLIETAPSWPIRECLVGDENQWIVLLRESAKRAGKL